MIGLGSNRLSVCRRGGMSVTQAGRGGMEWMGVRGPSWASPYSAQATAALLAQFPTQWPTIRDYGFAHPEIVGYMNAYAPEDAKIAYSLVEGIGTRYLVSDGTAWVETGHRFAANEGERRVKFYCLATGSSYRFWGSYKAGEGRSMMCYPISSKVYLGLGDGTNCDYNTTIDCRVGHTYEVWFKANNGAAEFKIYEDGELKKEGTYNYQRSIVVTATEPIFCDKESGNVMYKTPMRIESFETKEAGEYTQRLCPFIRNGQAGFINLVDGEFMGNAASSGTLTILDPS